MSVRAALVQMTSSDDPDANARVAAEMATRAAREGAALILTPEVTNCVSLSRRHQRAVLRPQDEDATLAALRTVAAREGVAIVVGSLALQPEPEGRFVNRSVAIDETGEVVATYDKIHMFDAEVDAENSYRESAGYAPGEAAVVVDLAGLRIGLSICYDMRFPALYAALAQAGAEVLTAPSAFTVPTGRAHWEVLLRARAIETGAWMLAPAQCGTHEGSDRQTWGHSLAVTPWGEVVADGGGAPGLSFVEIDPEAVPRARAAIPALANRRSFAQPSRA
ncbi:carbon-nitrogen hydrolase family protein [Roseobacter sp. HKCCA0434]|uniref:carbon-nitrogen hydrolase family protein n=1 Tax=Roseobacter sp. HKCCA0434 TaxID=3079297 RepID=UPI002905B341|nr:carbon-nitrogen hydrolase family protein [Roseobacter sp. HKCCA0434]